MSEQLVPRANACRRRLIGARILSFAVAMHAGALAMDAQSPTDANAAMPSMIADLIKKGNAALNDLNYDVALDFGRLALAQGRLRTAQAVTVNQLMAAAFYPDPRDGGTNAQPDSAVYYLRRVFKSQPDAALADVYRWSGMDSLFRKARAETFAAVARPDPENSLTGTDGRAFVEVISTRRATMFLRARSKRSGETITHDSSSGTARAKLALRAHNGTVPLFVAGDYELIIDVQDGESGETETHTFPVKATGSPPALTTIVPLSPSSLRPEKSPPSRERGILAGVLIGAATVAMSRYARAEEPIRSSISADGRAGFVGFMIAAGAITGGFLDKGVPLPQNIAANVTTRAAHANQMTAIQDENRKLVAGYQVTLTIDVENGK